MPGILSLHNLNTLLFTFKRMMIARRRPLLELLPATRLRVAHQTPCIYQVLSAYIPPRCPDAKVKDKVRARMPPALFADRGYRKIPFTKNTHKLKTEVVIHTQVNACQAVRAAVCSIHVVPIKMPRWPGTPE